MIPSTTKIILCGVIKEEMQSLLPPDNSIVVLDSDLHLVPEELHKILQEKIDSMGAEFDTIILGYGLCSLALVGLKANRCKLVIPRVDDCITLFLGSPDAYKEQSSKEPGTYYMTKGWIEAEITPFRDYDQLVDRYGKERADFMMSLLFKEFKRFVFIKGENSETDEPYHNFACHKAKQFGLHFEELTGSNEFFKKLLFGPWDDDFVIIEPGEEVTYSKFKK
jgi:hypothetical protein